MSERDIFVAALQKEDAAERRAFLDETCRADPALRARIEGLLRAYEGAGSFLEHPVAEPDLLPGTGPSQPDRGVAPSSAEKVGDVIGPYKLLQNLGEGGMGTVWVAEQTEPVQRHVALKVIKPGMDSAQIFARFEQERQALAVMDHPNIAKVLDGGQTGAGRPYFVMELVKGVPITTYCDQEQLTPKDRLELFIPVCQAVQHAHQKGIIHRDLKPSNVMIALYDGQPVPKVIDFGVAKATGQKLTERTMFTEVGSIVGTLEYMAPEQAELNNLDIDTRADIYSLGVLLYELLTGSPPFTSKQLRGAAFTEMLRMIKEVEPPKPSTKLSSSEELPSIAAKRKLEPKRLTKLVTGELDWVVMKCLEKERARRYETANGLANDLQRFLTDEPVMAGPPSKRYRLRKFVRRNRGTVIASTLVLIALVIGIVGATWGFVAARAAAIEERDAKDTALKSLNQLEKGNEIITSIFDDFDIRTLRDDKEPLQAILSRRLVKAAEQLEGEAVGDVLVVARLQDRLGLSLMSLGQYLDAISVLDKARTTRVTQLGIDHRDTLNSMNNLARAYQSAGKNDQAVLLLEETLRLKKAKLGLDDPDTLTGMNNLALAYAAAENYDKALPLFEETLRLRKARLGPDDPGTLRSMTGLALQYQRIGQFDKAVSLSKETLAIKKARLGPDHPSTLVSMNNLANAYQAAKKPDQVIALLEETRMILKSKRGTEHPDTLAVSSNLAFVYRNAGRLEEALPLFKEAVAGIEKLDFAHEYAGGIVHNLIDTYELLKQFDQAEAWQRKWMAVVRQRSGPASAPYGTELTALGHNFLHQQKWNDAETQIRESLTVLERASPDAWTIFHAKSLLGHALLGQKKYAEAEPFLLEGYEGMQKRVTKMPQPAKIRIPQAVERLAQLYDDWGKPDQAAEWRAKLPGKKPEGSDSRPKPD
jgi:serine/threonine protein kinase/tetratricopeptide (TPR) repeat protein